MKMNLFLKQRGIHLLLFFILLFGLTGTTQADSLKVRIIVSEAEIRLEPESTSLVIGRALLGSVLESEKKSGDWYFVSLPPDENNFIVSGYVHQDSVEIIGEAADLPQEKTKKPVRTPPQPEQIVRQPEQVKVPSVPEIIRPRRLYLKGIFGAGIGFDQIQTGIYKQSLITDEWREVILLPGGGIGLDVALGYRFLPSLMAEFGMAYESTGTAVKDTGEEIYFRRYPLTLTLIHSFKSKGKIQFYVGGGAGFYLNPKFFLNMSGLEIEIKYKPAAGFHGLIGISTNTKNKGAFFFGELRFSGIMNYEWETATVEGFSAIPSDEFQKLTGMGIYINFGLGYGF